MSSLFVLTFMFSTPAFFLGIINPQWVGLGNRLRSAALYGGLMAVSFLLLGVTAPKSPQPVSSGLLASIESPEFRVNAPLR